MLNILLIENDIMEIQNLVNYLSLSIPEVRICCIKSRCADALEVINSKEPDLILLNQNLPDSLSINIVDYIHSHNLTNYINSIILLGSVIDKQILNNTYVHSYIPKPINYDNLINTLNNFLHTKSYKKLLENKILKELSKLNFDFSHIGTQYLVEAISFIYSQQLNPFVLVKDVYPIIAEKHGTNVNTVKCDILHAIIKSYYSSDTDFLSKYFRIFPVDRPKPKYVISTILTKI